MYNLNNSNTNTTNSTPQSANIGGYNSYDYGLSLQGPFTMYSNPNNNNNESMNPIINNNNNIDENMNYMTSSVPNTNISPILNNPSYLSDHVMFDNNTPNTHNN